MDLWRLVRVSPDFRVIALGLPVPRYTGSPLDPPLRSRFQARDVKHLPFGQQLEVLMASAPSVDRDTLSQILSFSHTLLTGKHLDYYGNQASKITEVTLLTLLIQRKVLALVSQIFLLRTCQVQPGEKAVLN